MYKVASDRRQDALRRGRLADWVHGEEVLTLDEQLRQVRDGMKIIEARILTTTDLEERKTLGLQKLEMQSDAARLRKLTNREKRLRDGIAQYITNAAREVLTPSQFDMIYKRAKRQYDLDKSQFSQNSAP